MNTNSDTGTTLASLVRWTAAAREAAPKSWATVALFGLVTVIAAPMYVTQPLIDTSALHPSVVFGGSTILAHAGVVQAYWLIALPIAYLLAGGYMTVHALRFGVRAHTATLVVGGFAVYVVAVVAAVFAPDFFAGALPGTLTTRGLVPLLVAPIALLMWSFVERRWALAVTAAAVSSGALIANLYNVDNPLRAAGFAVPSEYGVVVNVLFCALVYAVCAVALFFAERN